MKFILRLIPAFLIAACLDCSGTARADSMSDEVLASLNRARTDPAGFAAVLQQYRARMHGNRYLQPGTTNSWVITEEGTAAVDEAIAVLRATPPLPALSVNPGLALAALDHVAWQGPRGEIGHGEAGGSSPSDRLIRRGVTKRAWGENISYGADGLQIVIDLIVDDGVASRGHRTNILNPASGRSVSPSVRIDDTARCA
ncbi:MAG: CAP domain-containing protein [Pseudomonadota bacterium]